MLNIEYIARVSTRPQKADLSRQVERLSTLYPGAEVIKEVGGGLNLRRKGLITLLGRVLRGDIGIIVVAHKDRLARFGFDIIEWLCEQFDCKIVVLNEISLSPLNAPTAVTNMTGIGAALETL